MFKEIKVNFTLRTKEHPGKDSNSRSLQHIMKIIIRIDTSTISKGRQEYKVSNLTNRAYIAMFLCNITHIQFAYHDTCMISKMAIIIERNSYCVNKMLIHFFFTSSFPLGTVCLHSISFDFKNATAVGCWLLNEILSLIRKNI